MATVNRRRCYARLVAGRRTNLGLGVLLVASAVSGMTAFGIGTPWSVPAATIHGVLALAVLILSPWKQVIVRRGWKRGQGRPSAAGLSVTVFLALATGLAQAAGFTTLGPVTAMQVHVAAGVGAVAFGIRHIGRHPVRPRRIDLDRRAFVTGAATLAAAAVLAAAWESTMRLAGWRGQSRRFTGSHEIASFRPDQLPVTSWINDRAPQDPMDSVLIAGSAVSVDELSHDRAERFEATLDCTGGWYSAQVWTGIPLQQLLPQGDWRSVVVRSVTGYTRRLPFTSPAYLVTHLGDQPLTSGHGGPVRLVAPGRRGFWWVKWVESVEPSRRPWWLHSPFPLT